MRVYKLVLAVVSVLLYGAVTHQAAAAVKLGDGAWSYFTDPRAVAYKNSLITGWITRGGRVQVAKYTPATKRLRVVTVGATGRDDHNNPAFVVRKGGRIQVFFSPHSGRHLPPVGVSQMYYRVTKRPGDIRSWGPTRTLPVNASGRLGYTYPNPINLTPNKFWLSWRGGGWLPTYSVYKDGKWSAAKEIVRGPNGQRPYAKYAAGRQGSQAVHVAYTQSHPGEYGRTSIYYLKYVRGKGFYRANGAFVGGASKLPFKVADGGTVYAYGRQGRAWIMDITDDGSGNPVVVYSVGFGRSMQYFRYARWDGQQWQDSQITPAYDGERKKRNGARFQTGGIVLNHADPSQVYLSRIVRGKAVVESWRTPDGGMTWQRMERLSPKGKSCFRPAAARGGMHRWVTFICGRLEHWTQYRTSVYAAKARK